MTTPFLIIQINTILKSTTRIHRYVIIHICLIRCTAKAKVGRYTEKVSNALAPKAKLNLLKQ